MLPLPDRRAGVESMEACLKVTTQTHVEKSISKNSTESDHKEMFLSCVCFQEGLQVWARQIQEGFCLFDGKRIPEDVELTSGQVV